MDFWSTLLRVHNVRPDLGPNCLYKKKINILDTSFRQTTIVSNSFDLHQVHIMPGLICVLKVRKTARIKNLYNQVPK